MQTSDMKRTAFRMLSIPSVFRSLIKKIYPIGCIVKETRKYDDKSNKNVDFQTWKPRKRFRAGSRMGHGRVLRAARPTSETFTWRNVTHDAGRDAITP